MNKIILNKILVKDNNVDYLFEVSKPLKKYFKHFKMFLNYNYYIEDIPNSILVIPFVANVIPLIWLTNSKLILKEIDLSFYNCLNKIKAAFENMYPNIDFNGIVTVEQIIDNTYLPEVKAASLFSGGLDALTTYIRIKEKKPLLITEYGWHEEEMTSSKVWESDKQNTIDFSYSNNLENILIQSNYGTFMNSENIDQDFSRKLNDSFWHGLHHGLAIISSAIPIAFKKKVECIYIASSNSPFYKVTCASDPTIDNEIKYGSGIVFHDGYELTRQDKVKVLVDYYSKLNEKVNIRVCFRQEKNCCNCEKCLRTILAIVAEGEDPRDFGFEIHTDLSEHTRIFLINNVKFLTETFIVIYWEIIQSRMRENRSNIKFIELLEWFLEYNFRKERKKSLLRYRTTNFFPIIKRKIRERVYKKIPQKLIRNF